MLHFWWWVFLSVILSVSIAMGTMRGDGGSFQISRSLSLRYLTALIINEPFRSFIFSKNEKIEISSQELHFGQRNHKTIIKKSRLVLFIFLVSWFFSFQRIIFPQKVWGRGTAVHGRAKSDAELFDRALMKSADTFVSRLVERKEIKI